MSSENSKPIFLGHCLKIDGGCKIIKNRNSDRLKRWFGSINGDKREIKTHLYSDRFASNSGMEKT